MNEEDREAFYLDDAEDIPDEGLRVADEDILEPVEASKPLPTPRRSYDEAKLLWASKRWGIPVEKIARVDLDMETEREFSTYGDAGSYPLVEVRIYRKTGGSPTFDTFGRYDFEEILREIFETGAS